MNKNSFFIILMTVLAVLRKMRMIPTKAAVIPTRMAEMAVNIFYMIIQRVVMRI